MRISSGEEIFGFKAREGGGGENGNAGGGRGKLVRLPAEHERQMSPKGRGFEILG